MSGIAQDELHKLSSRIKFGHQKAIKKNVALGNSRIFGYRKDNTLIHWICSDKINNGTDSCLSFTIYEEEIKEILYEVFKDTAEDAKLIIEEYTKTYMLKRLPKKPRRVTYKS